MGFFDKIKKTLFNKTDSDTYLQSFSNQNNFGEKLNRLKSVYKKLDADFLEELTIVLLEADIGIHTADRIIKSLKAKCDLYYHVTYNEVMEFLVESMHDIYVAKEVNDKIIYNENGPTVILIVGVNGAGKTTSIAKLTNFFKEQNKSVALVAGDTFRAGASEQLENWANKLEVPIIKGKLNQDSSSVIVDGCKYANENNIDILLCDTAGRLQNKTNLMNELTKMHKVIDKQISGGPHNCLLVIDGTTGQNGISQAENFNEATKLTGIILTKMDGTSKGGIVIAVKDKIEVPVLFIGLGEKASDLKEFDLDLYLYSITKSLNNE